MITQISLNFCHVNGDSDFDSDQPWARPNNLPNYVNAFPSVWFFFSSEDEEKQQKWGLITKIKMGKEL